MVNRQRASACCLLAGLAAVLTGCDSIFEKQKLARTPDPFEQIRNLDLEPRFPRPFESSGPPPKGPASATFFGQEGTEEEAARPAAARRGATKQADSDSYELNFDNAPVTTVAKVILGDILGTGYIIDPRIQGTITISSGRPIARTDLVFVLENALRTSNVVLVPDSSGYRLIPAGEAAGSGRTSVASAKTEPGFGISVVPLQFASAQAILKLLDSFALKAGAARADPTRNLVVIQGSGSERKAAVETILSFDVDWMRGQSVGIYPLESATPEALISDLEKIMESGEGGLNQSLVKLQPVSRLNAVLVVTKKPTLLKAAQTWIQRLDRSSNAAAGVRVYRLRYGSARQVAAVLSNVFGSGGTGGGLDSAAGQIAPGAGISTSTTLGRVAQSFSELGRSGATAGGLGVSTPGTGTLGSPGGGLGSPGGFGAPGGAGGPGGSTSSTTLGGTQTTVGGAGGLGGAQQSEQVASVSLPGVRITADVANNSLLIFANQENYRLIEQTIRQIDRPQLQVAIHATIAEITLNNQLQYGVQYLLQSSDIGYSRDKGTFGLLNNAITSTTTTTPGTIPGAPNTGTGTTIGVSTAMTVISRVLPGGNLLLGPDSNPRIILDALRGITDVKVLSTPSVVVIDNQVATLQVGDQVPIATQSATILTNPNTPLVNTVDYRNTGVILRVLPRINVNGNVILDIEQEISNVAPTSNALTLTPTISQRRVKSAIAVASGQSVLLGGLISERQERGRTGIPVLEELPVIGDAFAKNTRSTARTELVIFIQPQIIRDGVDAYKVAEELRTKLRGTVETSFPPGPSLREDPNLVR